MRPCAGVIVGSGEGSYRGSWMGRSEPVQGVIASPSKGLVGARGGVIAEPVDGSQRSAKGSSRARRRACRPPTEGWSRGPLKGLVDARRQSSPGVVAGPAGGVVAGAPSGPGMPVRGGRRVAESPAEGLPLTVSRVIVAESRGTSCARASCLRLRAVEAYLRDLWRGGPSSLSRDRVLRVLFPDPGSVAGACSTIARRPAGR
jgi:hypothetical protein